MGEMRRRGGTLRLEKRREEEGNKRGGRKKTNSERYALKERTLEESQRTIKKLTNTKAKGKEMNK